jgi:hypothetical protein
MLAMVKGTDSYLHRCLKVLSGDGEGLGNAKGKGLGFVAVNMGMDIHLGWA